MATEPEGSWSAYQLVIAVVMVVTGSVNTLAAKWADILYAPGYGPTPRKFDHPFLQAVCMFIGEFMCLPVFFLVHFIKKRQWARKSDLEKDLGNPNERAVIIFTGLLSVAFLRIVLRCFKWTGMFFVVVGLVIVGLSDILFGDHDNSDMNGIISGDLLIIMAQIVAAIQMVYEQKFVTKYDVPPLMAVGLEGFFGMTLLSILLIPMYFLKVGPPFSNDPEGRLENPLEAFEQMGQQPLIVAALTGTILSIAFFNFAGITVTKELSATTRMILDSVRTIVIWGFSLIFFKQQFVALQLLGFAFLILGMCVYNDLIFGPLIRGKLIPFFASRGYHFRALNSCCLPDLTLDDQDQLVTPIKDDEPLDGHDEI